MLDILLFRDEKSAELVRESQRRRNADPKKVDEIIAADAAWRKARNDVDELNREYNKKNKEVATKKKAKENADDLIKEAKAIDAKIKEAKEGEQAAKAKVDAMLHNIGNLVYDKACLSKDEDGNKIERSYGTPRQEEGLYNHVDLFHMIDGYDMERGNSVAGSRGFFLKGHGMLLNQAMINYGMSFLASKGYTPLHTPFFMNKSIMAECAQLSEFDEALYKVSGEGEEKYLIATSEQPIASYHRAEWMDPKTLPIRYAGYSTCFRKEAGSHGRDQLGIFRVHQFEKIEQFVLTSPDNDESWKQFETMFGYAEEFYQSLGIPYNVVNIASGALNNAAAMKLDLEAWFPASKAFRELVSCSNCLDYQSRRLEVRYGGKSKDEKVKKYVHMLNSTLCATERAMCCIVENYQTPTGIKIPEALQPFMFGCTFIPFVNAPPNPAKAKKDKGAMSADAKPPHFKIIPDGTEASKATSASAVSAATVAPAAPTPAAAPAGDLPALNLGDVTSKSGLKDLNKALESSSYVSGFQLTANDSAVYNAMSCAPDTGAYPHVARWYTHLTQLGAEARKAAPGKASVKIAKPAPGAKSPAHKAASPAHKAASPAHKGKKAAKPADDDDFDLFGDDDEEADAENEARLKAIADAHKAKLAAAGKSKKVVGKSSVVFELKPWEDTTPLDKMEELARKVEMEGLTWGAAKKAPIGYGIFKLVLMCTIVDDLVSTDALQEALEGNGDEDDVNDLAHYVQSVDIAAFNKI